MMSTEFLVSDYMSRLSEFDLERLETETAFIEDAVQELLKSRRLLKFSYIYGFYLEDGGYKKTIFEMMQVSSVELSATFSI